MLLHRLCAGPWTSQVTRLGERAPGTPATTPSSRVQANCPASVRSSQFTGHASIPITVAVPSHLISHR